MEGFFLIRLDKVDSDSGGLVKGMCLMQIILQKQKYVTWGCPLITCGLFWVFQKSILNNYGLRASWRKKWEVPWSILSGQFWELVFLWKVVFKLKDLIIAMQMKNIAWWTCCIYPLCNFKNIQALFKHFLRWSGTKNLVSYENCFLNHTSVSKTLQICLFIYSFIYFIGEWNFLPGFSLYPHEPGRHWSVALQCSG